MLKGRKTSFMILISSYIPNVHLFYSFGHIELCSTHGFKLCSPNLNGLKMCSSNSLGGLKLCSSPHLYGRVVFSYSS